MPADAATMRALIEGKDADDALALIEHAFHVLAAPLPTTKGYAAHDRAGRLRNELESRITVARQGARWAAALRVRLAGEAGDAK